MRYSPLSSENEKVVRAVRHHRRIVLVGAATVFVLCVGATWISTTRPSPGKVTLPPAFARVVGSAGSSTGTAIADSLLVTDGGVFVRVGDTVSVQFASGSEFQGAVIAVRRGNDSLGVALVKLLGGELAPASVTLGSFSGSEAGKGVLVCVGDDGIAQSRSLSLSALTEQQLPQAVLDCGPGSAVISASDSPELLGLVVSGRGHQLRLVSTENMQLN